MSRAAALRTAPRAAAGAGPALTAWGTAQAGTLELELAADVGAGEVVALVGPNGAGKSATLAVMLGFLPLLGGFVAAGGRVLDNGRRRAAPHRRGLGWCPQVPALLPHRRPLAQLTPFARRDAPVLAASGSVAELLAELGIDPADRRPPHRLSGGEAQRVAVARALTAGGIVLLDEPTAAQDATGAAKVRAAVRRHTAGGGTAVVVTHRPEDSYGLADRLVVLDGGRVVQSGTPAELAARPATPYVARAVGATILDGVVGPGGRFEGPWGVLAVPDGTPAGPATATIRPAAVTVHRERPGGSPRNVLHGRIRGVVANEGGVRVELDTDPPLVAALTHAAAAELDVTVGTVVWAAVKAHEVDVGSGR